MPPRLPVDPVNSDEEWLFRQLPFLADGVVRGKNSLRRREITLQRWYTGVSVVFSLLGAAGLVRTKVEALPADQLSWAFVVGLLSLIVLIVFELYRAFGVEHTASQLRAANDAYSALEVETRQALQKDDPRPAIEKLMQQAGSLELMFHLVLLPATEADIDSLVHDWIAKYRPANGWCLTASQQKPKRK